MISNNDYGDDDELVPAFDEVNNASHLDMDEEEVLESQLVKLVGEGNIVRNDAGKILKWVDENGDIHFAEDEEEETTVMGHKAVKPKPVEGVAAGKNGEPVKPNADNDDADNFLSFMAAMEIDEIETESGNVKVNDLKPSEREAVLINLVSNITQQLSNVQAPVLEGDLKVVADFLATGKTLNDIGQLIQQAPAPVFDGKEDKEIVLMSLKEQFPKKTEAQLEKIVSAYDDEELEAEANEYKADKAKSIKTPAEILAEQSTKAKQMEIDNDRREAEALVSFSKGLRQIEGIPTNTETLNETLKYVIPQEYGGVSEFLQEVSTREGLLKVAFLRKNFDALIKEAREDERAKILGELPDAGEYKNYNANKGKLKKDGMLDKLPESVKARIKSGEDVVY